MELKDKVAMVTGAGSGIGRSIAIAFAKEGAKLILVDLNEESLSETFKMTRLENQDVIAEVLDVTDYSSVEQIIKNGLNKFGRIDIQANVAGICVRKGLMEHTLEDWDLVIRVNLTGVFFCIKAVAPAMIKQKYGKIINIGSIAGIVGQTYTAYTASKAGVVNLSKGLALELAPHNININAICPGIIKTSMSLPEMEQRYIAKIPQGRMGEPEDIANAAIYLASDGASFINGTTLVVDGGTICGFHPF